MESELESPEAEVVAEAPPVPVTVDPEGAPGVSVSDNESETEFVVRVFGEPLKELPKDLYIPPEALEVFLEAFQGPLDLLLYLIKRQNLDILDIDVSEITRQYMEYVEIMKAIRLELAAEYLVMSATLAEIKSRCLLPKPGSEDDEEEDPRAELIRRLLEYERFKKAAEDIDALPRLERDAFVAAAVAPKIRRELPEPTVDLSELLHVFGEVMARAKLQEHHQVARERLSTRERMSEILSRVNAEEFVPFTSLFQVEEGRHGVVTTFLALMELVKSFLLDLVQNESFGPIHVKAKGGA